LIPFVGLFLAPFAVALGLFAWWRGPVDHRDKGIGPAGAAILLGLAVALTQWIGLVLMVRGWAHWQ
jgi:hypothetical protein